MYSTPSKRISKGWTSSLSTTSAICWQSSNSVTLRWTHTTSFHAQWESGHRRLLLCSSLHSDCSAFSTQGLHPICSQTPEQPGLRLEKSGFCSQIHHLSWTSHLNNQFPRVKYKGREEGICIRLFCKVFSLSFWTSCIASSYQCGSKSWWAVLQPVPAGTRQWYPTGPDGFPRCCWLMSALLLQEVSGDGWSSWVEDPSNAWMLLCLFDKIINFPAVWRSWTGLWKFLYLLKKSWSETKVHRSHICAFIRWYILSAIKFSPYLQPIRRSVT